MLELIKNSMRATVDFHGLDEMDNNPIRVVIADGEENEVGVLFPALALICGLWSSFFELIPMRTYSARRAPPIHYQYI